MGSITDASDFKSTTRTH